MKRYVIFNQTETNTHPDLGPAFWSNAEGWTALHQADILEEIHGVDGIHLPVGGELVELPRLTIFLGANEYGIEPGDYLADEIADLIREHIDNRDAVTHLLALFENWG
jgi:hypothetical protein